MGNLIRSILWIVGLTWFFTDKDAKPARNTVGKAIIYSWIGLIIIALLVLLLLPNNPGVDNSRVNGW
jgi:hypothetical protein